MIKPTAVCARPEQGLDADCTRKKPTEDRLTVSQTTFASGVSFLIVEDEALIAMMLELMLSDAGAEDITIAGSIAEALVSIARATADVAIFDRRVGDGISYPAAIKAREHGSAIIIASGSHDLDLPAALADAIILSKPFTLPHLERAVVAALNQAGRAVSAA